MTLGQQIKQAREEKKISQEELAEQLGVSRQAVSKWENDNSIPQGLNREIMSQVLDLNLSSEENGISPPNKLSWIDRSGWGLSFVLAILLIVVCIWNYNAHDNLIPDGNIDGMTENGNLAPDNDKTILASEEDTLASEQDNVPRITRISFYDDEQNEVTQEALWYNSAAIESILVQWEGGIPNNIKIFSTPSGSETEEFTELILTKSVLDGDTAALLNAGLLKEKVKDVFQGHIFFELDFGENIVASEIYNMFYESIEE